MWKTSGDDFPNTCWSYFLEVVLVSSTHSYTFLNALISLWMISSLWQYVIHMYIIISRIICCMTGWDFPISSFYKAMFLDKLYTLQNVVASFTCLLFEKTQHSEVILSWLFLYSFMLKWGTEEVWDCFTYIYFLVMVFNILTRESI